jgi:hypothetical protein
MSETPKQNAPLLTFLGSVGAILIFALVVYLAYLPNRPAPIDQSVAQERQAKADEARAAGIAKLSNYAVSGTGAVQIPIEEAMKLVVEEYQQ